MEIYLQSRPCASYACTLSYTSHLPSVYGVVMFTRDKIMLIFIKSRVNAQKQKESAILCKRSVDLICIYCSNRVITTIFYKSTTRPGCKPVDFVGSATRALVQLHYKLYNRAPWPILLIFFLTMGVTLRRIYIILLKAFSVHRDCCMCICVVCWCTSYESCL